MNLKQLPYILAIASTGSLSKAAELLQVSQPALSKYLAELERNVGMELFFRHKKRLYPTPAGRLYLDAAREIITIQTRTQDTIRLLHSPDIEKIHIGISPHRGAASLARIYPSFNQYFPQVRLIPHEGYALTLGNLVLQNEIRWALTSYVSSFDEHLDFIPLTQEEIVLGVPVFHRPDQASSGVLEELPYIDLEEFKGFSFIMPEPPSALYEAGQSLFERSNFHPLVAFSSPNVILCEAMIRTGTGVGILPSSYIKADPDIIYLRIRQTSYMRSGILCQKNHHFSMAERFLFFLQIQQDAHANPSAVDWDNPWVMDITREFGHTHFFTDMMEKRT